MADNSEDILKQLQQFEQEPPAGALEKALHALRLDNSSSLSSPEEREKVLFAQLQDYSVAAPAVDLAGIIKTGQVKQLKSNTAKKWLSAAAAVILIALSAVIYKITTTPASSGNDMVNSATPPAKPLEKEITASGDPKKDSLSSALASTSAKSAPKKAEDINASAIKKPATSISKRRASNAGFAFNKKQHKNGEAVLYSNDVFLTLVSYQLPGWQQFFNKSVSEKKVTLNKYSYHNLSDKMVEMLQEIYFVKRNGKPSRKAKKAKRKFEKWRKKDETFFDKTLQRNPVDIIDLSEFLQKNK